MTTPLMESSRIHYASPWEGLECWWMLLELGMHSTENKPGPGGLISVGTYYSFDLGLSRSDPSHTSFVSCLAFIASLGILMAKLGPDLMPAFSETHSCEILPHGANHILSPSPSWLWPKPFSWIFCGPKIFSDAHTVIIPPDCIPMATWKHVYYAECLTHLLPN